MSVKEKTSALFSNLKVLLPDAGISKYSRRRNLTNPN